MAELRILPPAARFLKARTMIPSGLFYCFFRLSYSSASLQSPSSSSGMERISFRPHPMFIDSRTHRRMASDFGISKKSRQPSLQGHVNPTGRADEGHHAPPGCAALPPKSICSKYGNFEHMTGQFTTRRLDNPGMALPPGLRAPQSSSGPFVHHILPESVFFNICGIGSSSPFSFYQSHLKMLLQNLT